MKITNLEWTFIKWALEGLKRDAEHYGDADAVVRVCDQLIEKIKNEKENEE